MSSNYIPGDDWEPVETLPERGHFLVQLEREMLGTKIHVANIRPNYKVVSSVFHFDAPPIKFWRNLPKEREE